MSRGIIRNLSDISDITDRFIKSTAIFEGSYGCTFDTIQKLEDDNDAHKNERERRAVKIQGYDKKDTKSAEDITQEVVIGLTLSNITRDTTPGVVKIFDNFKSRSFPSEWKQTAKENCENFYDFIVDRQIREKFYWYLVMEYGDGGDLSSYLHSADIYGNGLSSDEILSFSFQLIWTLHCLQTQIGFRHFDLKPNNIILKNINTPRIYQFSRTHNEKNVKDPSWTMFLGPENKNGQFNTSKHELKIIDFGMSKVAKSPNSLGINAKETDIFLSSVGGTVTYMDPKVFFLDTYKTKKIDRGYDADMWSVGIILIDLCLSGWRNPSELNHESWTDNDTYYNTFQEVLLFFVGATEQKLMTHLTLIKPALGEPFDPYGYDTNWRDVVVGICLLNDALGNGLLPNIADWPEVENSELYIQLKRAEKDLKKLAAPTFNGKKLYDYVIDRIREKMGTSGLQLIKNLLEWSPARRIRSGLSLDTNPQYFYTTLLSTYFVPLKKDLFNMLNYANKQPDPDSEVYTWRLQTQIEPLSLQKDKKVQKLEDLRYSLQKNPPSSVTKEVEQNSQNVIKDENEIVRKLRNGKIIYKHKQNVAPIGFSICSNCFAKKTAALCSSCKKAGYCSKSCQKDHWNIHKSNCNK